MANSEEASIKLTNTHVNKLSAAKKTFKKKNYHINSFSKQDKTPK